MHEKFDFRGISNLDVKTGSDLIFRPGQTKTAGSCCQGRLRLEFRLLVFVLLTFYLPS